MGDNRFLDIRKEILSIFADSEELKALFTYSSEVVRINKIRALSNVESVEESLQKVKAYLENL